MSGEKMTRVGVPGSQGTGLLLRGHVTREEAVAEYESHLRQKLAEAQAALDAIESGAVEVRHQRGIYRVSDVHLVEAVRCVCGGTGKVVRMYPDSDPEPWRPGSYADGVVQPCPGGHA